MKKFPKRLHDWHEFLALYDKADDRTCAILFGARLDDALGNALLRTVKKQRIFEERLLGETAPLGTFSAKIDMLYCLGFIGDETYHDLHVVRKIRNEFAHRLEAVNFSVVSVQSKVMTLLLPKMRSDAKTFAGLSSDTRTMFVVGAALCDGELGRVSVRSD